jgi:hypothetical protein
MNGNKTIIGLGYWSAYRESPAEPLSEYGSREIAGTIVMVYRYNRLIPTSLDITGSGETRAEIILRDPI